jgi:hypothetical protein
LKKVRKRGETGATRIRAGFKFSLMTPLMEMICLFSFGDLDGATLLTEKVEREAKVRGVY